MPRVVCWREPRQRTPESDQANAINELFFDLVFASTVSSVVYEVRTSFIYCPEADKCGFGEHITAMLQSFFPFYWLAYQLVM